MRGFGPHFFSGKLSFAFWGPDVVLDAEFDRSFFLSGRTNHLQLLVCSRAAVFITVTPACRRRIIYGGDRGSDGMEVYLTAAGEVAVRPSAPEATVAGLLAAMAVFGRGAVDCAGCAHTCCAGLPVFADNVFVRSLCALARPAVGGREAGELPRRVLRLDPLSHRWLLRPDGAGRCRFLAADGRCLIYGVRPLVCRLHLCLPSEAAFARLKDDLYFAYRHALACELAGLDGQAPAAAANPLIGATAYDAVIGDVAAWARAARPGWPTGFSP